MKLVREVKKFARRHKKALWWTGGGLAAATLLYVATRGPKRLPPPPPDVSSSHWVPQGQRVIAWSPSTVLNYGPGKGQVYIKFQAADGHIRGGFVDESIVLRDSSLPAIAVQQESVQRALSGLGAGAQPHQQQVPTTPTAVPNAVIVEDSMMFATSGGKARKDELQKQLVHIIDVVTSGAGVFVSDETTFRKIYTHQGAKVLELIPSIFYDNNGNYTTSELANHAHCQTWNAAVVQLGNNWMWPFYNQYVYRYSADVTPDLNLNRYPNSPIDPIKDNAAFEAAVNAAMEASIQTALKKASLDSILKELEVLVGNSFYTLLFGKLAGLGLMIDVSPQTRDMLARYARDSAAQGKIPLPTTMKVESGLGVLTDEPIPEPMLTILHSSAGAFFVSGMIDVFESHEAPSDEAKKAGRVTNPCIVPLDEKVVGGMFLAVLSIFLSIVSLGSAGFFGPVIAAISFVTSLPNNILQLAALSGVPVPDISVSGLGVAIDKLLSKPKELEKLIPK